MRYLRDIYLEGGITAVNNSLSKADYGTFTLQEIGDILGITRERVRQIELQALRKLRQPKVGRKLRQYIESCNTQDLTRIDYGREK